MKTNITEKDVKNVTKVKNREGVEEVEGGKTMTRVRALRPAGKVTLAAGVMMVLLNNPKRAQAASKPGPVGGSGGLAKPSRGNDW